MDKKPKRKKSLSSKINSLKKQNEWLVNSREEILKERNDLRSELHELRRCYPAKYYELEYYVITMDEKRIKDKQVIRAYCIELAIDSVERIQRKIYKESFLCISLINIKVLA